MWYNKRRENQYMGGNEAAMQEEDWLRRWENRRVQDTEEDDREIANMNETDFAAMLEELEYK